MKLRIISTVLIGLYIGTHCAGKSHENNDRIIGTVNTQKLNQLINRVSEKSECPDCATCNKGCFEGNPTCQQVCIGRTAFIPRSIGANTARELVGWQSYIHTYSQKGYYATFALAPGYTHSFRPVRIAHLLFGNNVISFAGSQVAERQSCSFLADYFGLAPDFRGSIHIDPVIKNYYVDLQAFIGLDPLWDGLYVRAHMPIVQSHWDLHVRSVQSASASEFPTCYMGTEPAPALPNLETALHGNRNFGTTQGRRFGNIPFHHQEHTAVADIDLILGYDFWKYREYYLGVYLQGVAPTGNRPNPRCVFSPLVGNGHHWEAGVGISGRLLLWDRGPDTTLNAYVEGNLTHLFKDTQLRSFDLCNNGLYSRYLLLKEFEADGITPTGTSRAAIDYTTRLARTWRAAKGDISFKLAYRNNGIDADLGYNFYGHTHERVCLEKCTSYQNYGIKGTEGTCYRDYTVTAAGDFGTLSATRRLTSTQSNATAFMAGIPDNPVVPADLPAGDVAVTWNNTRVTGSATGPGVHNAYNSEPPVLLTDRDLDLRSAATCAYVTHKLFGYVGYSLYNPCNYATEGFIGVGGEVEFEGLARDERSSMYQWGVFGKAGISY